MEKIKHFVTSEQGKDILIVTIIILVGLGSFGLGRLSKNPPKEALKIEYSGEELSGSALESLNALKAPNTATNGPNSATSTQGHKVFASSRGSKYYPVGCSAGSSLSQANRIYFDSREAAEAAGYTLSSSCR